MTRDWGRRTACLTFLFAAAAAAAEPLPLVVNEGFELFGAPNAGIYANGWIRQDNSEQPAKYGHLGHGWHRQSPYDYMAYDAPPQSFIVPLNALEVPDSGVVSVWLLSPPIAFGESFSLSFQARSFVSAELDPAIDRLQVRLCSGSACSNVGSAAEDVGDFGQLLLDINADEASDGFPGEWTPYTIGAGSGVPGSGVGRIAFRYYVRQTPTHRASGRLGLDRVVIGSHSNGTAGLRLALTAAPFDAAAPDACNGASRIEATLGDRISLCYEVTNTSADTVRYHWLRDDRVGTILSADTRELAPGASYRYNRAITVGRSETISAAATAQTEPQDYRYDDSQPLDYVDAGDGEPLTPGTVETMPFDFRFYRKSVSRYCVTNDGVFAVAQDYRCPDAVAGALPSSNPDYIADSPFAAVYATKLWSRYGSIRRKLVGTAPNRKLVIQWYQKVPATIPPGSVDPSHGLDAELILHEGTDQLEFQYRNTRFGALPQEDDGGNASIGLQKDLQGIRYSYQTPSLAAVRRIVWTPTAPSVHVDARALDIVGLAPELRHSADAITANLPAQGGGRVQLGIGNAGEGRLDWSSGTASASQGLFPASVPTRAQRDPLLAGAGSGERPLYSFDLLNTFDGIGYGSLIHFNPTHPDYSFPDGAASLGVIDGRLIYAIAFADDDFSRIYAIDHYTHQLMRWNTSNPPATGSPYEVIGTVPLLLNWITGMRQDPTTGTMYLSTSEGAGSALWTLDLATASVQPVGTITNAPQLADLAFDTQGQLYAIDEALGSLLMLDKHTAEAIVIGALDPNAVGALAFDYDPAIGRFYLLSSLALSPNGSGALWIVDPATAVSTFQSEIFGIDLYRAMWQSLAVAHRMNACTAPEDVPWLSLSPRGGSIAAGAASQPLSLDFNGAGLPDGQYSANLCLYSNDPYARRLMLPVHMQLGADALFADGFESNR